MKTVICAVFLILAAFRPASSQAPAAAWGEGMADRLAAVLPTTAKGLTDGLPWEIEHEPIGKVWGCALGCSEFMQVSVGRKWAFDDPKLVAAVQAAEAQAMTDATRASAEVASKGASAAMPLLQKAEAAGRRVDEMKRGGRSLEVIIDGNAAGTPTRGVERPPTRIGAVAGYPAFRFAFSDDSYAPVTEGVRLVVFVGPESFKNREVDEKVQKGELKTIRVAVAIQSTPASAKADEALARQVLEAIDYKALAALLR